MSSSFYGKFDYCIMFPREDYSDPSTPMYRAVQALINCEHGHWFLVKSDEFSILCNSKGLECIREALPHIPALAYSLDAE